MGKKSRKSKPTDAPKVGSLIDASPEFYAHLKALMEQRDERRSTASTAGTSRVNIEAERIATEARVFKKAKQNQKAHEMYTQAIEMDKFNHVYFHHRAETAWNGKVRYVCMILEYE